MSGRPFPLLLAIVLLLIIGLSGLAVGVSLIAVMAQGRDVPWVGLGIGAGIAAYGALTSLGGIGVLLRRRPAWWLAVVTIAAGLAFLVGLVVALGNLDPIFAFGILLWSVTLACLVAPATRAAIGAGLR